MADPVAGWASAALTKYGAIGAGLAIGTAAKYGLTLTEGKRLTWRGVITDLLLLGFLGLLAILIADWFALTGNARVLAGALAAVSSDRLVRLVRDRFMQRADREMARTLDLPADTSAVITGTPPAPPVVRARTSPEVAPLMRRELRAAYPLPKGHDPVADHLIAKLGDDI